MPRGGYSKAFVGLKTGVSMCLGGSLSSWSHSATVPFSDDGCGRTLLPLRGPKESSDAQLVNVKQVPSNAESAAAVRQRQRRRQVQSRRPEENHHRLRQSLGGSPSHSMLLSLLLLLLLLLLWLLLLLLRLLQLLLLLLLLLVCLLYTSDAADE